MWVVLGDTLASSEHPDFELEGILEEYLGLVHHHTILYFPLHPVSFWIQINYKLNPRTRPELPINNKK